MTKPTPQSEPQVKTARSQPSAKPQDLQIAYQCHTLAQLVFGQLAATYPWLATPVYPGVASPWQQPPQGPAPR